MNDTSAAPADESAQAALDLADTHPLHVAGAAADGPEREHSDAAPGDVVGELELGEPVAEESQPLHVGGASADDVLPPDAAADDEAPWGDIPEESLPDLAEFEALQAAEPGALGLETPLTFFDLGLSEPILRAVTEKGYLHPTPIQAQAIPIILMGRDVMGVAQTGTGKTAGFTLPMLDILSGSRARARMPRSLILEPTRELALQVAENFVQYGKYLKLTHALLIGGESMNDQKEALMRGVDVLIATPGRLIDLFERGGMLLTDCRLLVIDEADRMLDMGFIPDVERIVGLLPANRQTLFFSATMAPEIKRLTDAFLQNPREVKVDRAASVATTITAGLAVVDEMDKRETLRRLIASEDVQNALIFCNRKTEVDILNKSLNKHGFSAGALHGDLAQSMRFATLEKFKAGALRLLVCSDVAARGIDIGGLSHVFNFDVPHHAEDYVHRIGRTGRAGREGRAFTIATPDDKLAVTAIEALTGSAIPRIDVEGMAQLPWSDVDGRKRRGGRRPAAGGGRGGAAARPGARGGRGAGDQPSAEPPPAARRERERRPAREAAAESVPAAIVAPSEPRPERDFRDRPMRPRDGRRREEDLGPAVLAFGEETPAFMTLPRRRVWAAEQVVDSEL